ncbi:hypothetical protein MKK70_18520 [Methylobacterium sp. E-041]|jgi:hypothetical protein|uniref:hypothetical protein n=1 Tax=Methylobacterium sp. E-041 TaxID=2836573 RepID=UPI001FBB3798|nr:hypothetical protein [Methylobacterium sp. E-041]MCJ2107342.1 hypothetical protein [Methylobacterium sp. E-041]
MVERRNVETLVVLQPIAVDTPSPDNEGMLVIANRLLVAVLVRPDAEHEAPGSWFVEVALDRLLGIMPPPFNTLEDATRWLRNRLRP